MQYPQRAVGASKAQLDSPWFRLHGAPGRSHSARHRRWSLWRPRSSGSTSCVLTAGPRHRRACSTGGTITTPPWLPGNFSILGILRAHIWEAPNTKQWVCHCWLGFLLQSQRRTGRSDYRQGCGDLWESLSSVLGPKGSVEVETTNSRLLYALNTVCVWLSVFVLSSLYWMASWGSMYCVKYVTDPLKRSGQIFGQIFLHLWGLFWFGDQSCVIHFNKELLFRLEEAAMSLYLTGNDFQDKIAKLSTLLTLQSAVSFVHTLTSNLTTSPLGTMEKPCDKYLFCKFTVQV